MTFKQIPPAYAWIEAATRSNGRLELEFATEAQARAYRQQMLNARIRHQNPKPVDRVLYTAEELVHLKRWMAGLTTEVHGRKVVVRIGQRKITDWGIVAVKAAEAEGGSDG